MMSKNLGDEASASSGEGYNSPSPDPRPTGSAAGSSQGATASELTFNKENRRHLRTKVTKLITSIHDNIDDFDEDDCEDHLQTLGSYASQLCSLDEKINAVLWMHEQRREILNKEMDACEKYQFDISKITRKINKRFSVIGPTNNVAARSSNHAQSHNFIPNKLQLPQLPLPEFSNAEGESLSQFFSEFESIISKYSLSQYEKFIYLCRQLKNSPLTLVKSLQGDEQSYDQAKMLLEEAFASAIQQKFDILERLIKLKLSNNSDPYAFISEIKILIKTYKFLQIEADHVLQFFIWRGMPNELKAHFTSITNENIPSLEKIEQNLFASIKRFKTSDSGRCSNEETVTGLTASASNIEDNNFSKKTQFKPCILCSTSAKPADHGISRCTVYSSAEDKVGKLNSLTLCNCCTGKHRTSDCQFNFYKPCIHCRGKHFHFLCMNSSPQVSVESNTVVVHCNALPSGYSDSVLLPTMSLELENGTSVRILKDSGAQFSFILESHADDLGMKILKDNISLLLVGFNIAKSFTTKMVEVPLKIDGKIKIIQAYCIPNIPTNLKLPGLGSAVARFKSKGYTLADKFLDESSDNVSGIGLVLGVNGLHCLPGNDVPYGESSIYIQTSIGITIMGSINKIYSDADFLQILSLLFI